MSRGKFDYDLFKNHDVFEKCFAVNKKYSQKEAIEIVKRELNLSIDQIDYIFESYVEFGYYSVDGERYLGWSIRDVSEPVEKKRNSVEVWVIKIDW